MRSVEIIYCQCVFLDEWLQIESRPHKKRPLRITDDSFSTPSKLDNNPMIAILVVLVSLSFFFPDLRKKLRTALCCLYLLNPFDPGLNQAV